MAEDHYFKYLSQTRFPVGGGSIMIWQHFLQVLNFNKCKKELKSRLNVLKCCYGLMRAPWLSFITVLLLK